MATIKQRKQARDYAPFQSVSAYIVLRQDGTEVAKVQAYHGKASGHSPYINLRIGEGYGEINPAFYSSGTASIEIKLRSLDVETAIAVCKLLRQFARETE